MTLNMHLHNSSTSSKLPVMPLCHFKKQQKTAWRKLSDVLKSFLWQAVQWITLLHAKQKLSEYGASHNRFKPLSSQFYPYQFSLLSQLPSESHFNTVGSPKFFITISIIILITLPPRSVNTQFHASWLRSITHDTERVRFSARLPSESFPTWGNMPVWPM